MTPKEKAEELLKKMLGKNPNRQDGISRIDVIQAKQCALLAVDEILNLYHPYVIVYKSFEDNVMEDMTQEYYWKQVKHEIEKL